MAWSDWKPDMPVQVCGVTPFGEVTPNGWGVVEFANLEEARKVFPDLDPAANGERFSWAMRGQIKGQDAMRFESWQSEKRYGA